MIKCDKGDVEIKGGEGVVGAEIGVLIHEVLAKGIVSEYILDMVIAKVKDLYRKGGVKND